MGAPKQKWNPEEEAALKAGVLKHGPGKWRTILKDPQFSRILYLRSNVDLKDKWRNMSVLANGWGNRERARLALRMTHSSPRFRDSSKAYSTGSQSDEENDGRMHTGSGSSSPNDGEKTSVVRLETLILEAIHDLREAGGSNKSSIAAYIEDQFWAPPNFKRILSAKLKQMAAHGKLFKMNRKYRITSASTLSEGRRNSSTPFPVDKQRTSHRFGAHNLGNFMEIQSDLDLAKMSSMTPEEAAAAADEAVAEAEAALAEAEEAEREAVAAEAEAEAAHKFAEAALKTAKEKRSPAMNEQMIPV